MATLNILHFNDVYRVQPFKLSPQSPETIDVTQWAAMLDDVRGRWPVRPDGARDGLVLFSGDVFSPSVESSVTRGSHMVPVMNAIAPDVSLTGEPPPSPCVDRPARPHRADLRGFGPAAHFAARAQGTTISTLVRAPPCCITFEPVTNGGCPGYPHLSKLIQDTHFVSAFSRTPWYDCGSSY